SNLFDARHHQTLALLDRLDVVVRLQQRLVGAGIEPRDTARQLFDVQLTAFEIGAVDVGDLELAPGRRLQRGGDVDDLIVVEIQPRYCIRRFGGRGLFLDADRASFTVELDDAVALRIPDQVPEHGGAHLARRGRPDVIGEVRAVKNVVAQSEGHAVAANEPSSDHKGLREAVRARLNLVLDRHAELGAVAQQTLEPVLLVRRRDDQYGTYPAEHQRRQRVVDHRLAVN